MNQGDCVRDIRTGELGRIVGTMRWKGVFLVKGRDFERWVAEGYLKEERCTDSEKESSTP